MRRVKTYIIPARSSTPGPQGDQGIQGPTGSTGPQGPSAPAWETTNGVFEWWIHPAATFQTEPYPRTVFGVVATNGDIAVCEYNHAAAVTKRYVIGTAVADDHCPPATYVAHGRRTFVVWTKHNGDNNLHYKIGDASGDLSQLVVGSQSTWGAGAATSYTQVHKITALSDDDQDTFWLFYRRNNLSWRRVVVSINQATGAATWSSDIQIILSAYPGIPGQVYISTADAFATGSQVLRIGIGYNPDVASEAVWYYELDCVTGDITTPADDTFTANISGTNLPIDLATETPMIATPGGATQRHMFAVRPGPDSPALGYAEWDGTNSTTAAACRYYVAEINGGTDHLTLNAGSAQVASSTGLDDAAGVTIIVAVRTPGSAPAGNCELARRWDAGSASNSAFRLSIRNDQKVEMFTIRNDTTAIHNFVTSSAIPFSWGDDVAVRAVVDAGTSSVVLSYSLNPLDVTPTWTVLQTSVSFTTTMRPSTLAFVVGGLAATAVAPICWYASLKNDAGSLIAGVDWRTEWPISSATYVDAASKTWSLTGTAALYKALPILDAGAAGPIFGYFQVNGYYPGVGFQCPSYGRAVVTASRVSGTDAVTLKRPSGSTYADEVLYSQPSTDGRLIRPYAPINGGPLRALFGSINSYSSYTDYDIDIKSGT